MIYKWFACNGEAGGYLCCKPLGHSGKCLVKFSNTTKKLYFDYVDDGYGKYQTPITITEKEIEKFDLDKKEILEKQWSLKDIEKSNAEILSQSITVQDCFTETGRKKLKENGVRFSVSKNKQVTFIIG